MAAVSMSNPQRGALLSAAPAAASAPETLASREKDALRGSISSQRKIIALVFVVLAILVQGLIYRPFECERWNREVDRRELNTINLGFAASCGNSMVRTDPRSRTTHFREYLDPAFVSSGYDQCWASIGPHHSCYSANWVTPQQREQAKAAYPAYQKEWEELRRLEENRPLKCERRDPRHPD